MCASNTYIYTGPFCQFSHDLTLLLTQWDSNSQPTDDPFAVSKEKGQIHCTNGVKTYSRLFRHAWTHGRTIRLNSWVHHGMTI